LRTKKHFAMRGGLPLAAALIALALGAPTASAATFGGGTFSFSPSRAFTKQVKFTPTAPATRSGRGVAFEISNGTSTMSQSNTGSFNLRGGFRVRAGRRRATATSCAERLAASVARLTCRFGRRTVALFEQVTTGGKIAPDAAFTGLTGTAIRTRLSRAGASFLNRTLRLSRASASRVRARQSVGTSALDAVRFLEATGGTTTTAYDQRFYDKLQSCNIRLEAIAPATADETQRPGAPRGSVDLPVASGTFNARFLATRATARAAQAGVPNVATLNLGGGTRLQRDNPPYTSDLTNFVQDFSTTPPTLSAFASRFNQTLPIGTLEGGVIRMNLTDTGGSITLQDGRLVISSLAADVLSSDTGCALGPDERTIGTSSGTVTVS
jgi:hypothetical protein